MIICSAALAHAEKTLSRSFNQFEAVEKAAQITTNLKRSPALFILPFTSSPHGRPVDNGTRFDRALEVFIVGIALKASGRDKLSDLQKTVMAAFQGHMLEGCRRQISWKGGSLLQAGAGVVIWQNKFETLVNTGE